MKIKVSDTTNTQLDWLVLEAQGANNGPLLTYEGNGRKWIVTEGGFTVDYATNWSQGGPIIEREKIDLGHAHPGSIYCSEGNLAYAHIKDGRYVPGPTPLIAAMRCFVASRLGNEVEVPNDLA